MFSVNEHKNTCIAGLNRQAGHATEASLNFKTSSLQHFREICILRCLEKNCAEYYKKGVKVDGIYSIDPDGKGSFKVYCDMTTSGGGWTVFQHRFDGSVDFYRGWQDYKKGFGELDGEFWLGLEKIHRLTRFERYRLRIDLGDTAGNMKYAEYSYFAITSEKAKYQLSLGSYSG